MTGGFDINDANMIGKDRSGAAVLGLSIITAGIYYPAHAATWLGP